jgi:hypothetical protein
MALVVAKIKKDLEAAILAALKTQFAKEGGADSKSHQKMAAAIADGVSKVMVNALQKDAQVLPGIPTSGSAAAQATTKPGKIS